MATLSVSIIHSTFFDFFFCCNRNKVLFPQQKFGVDKLREQGVDIKDHAYDMGHSSHPNEMKEFAAFVDSCIFGNGDGEL
jgi:hypothetical protein